MKHWFSGNLYPLSIQIPTKRSGPHKEEGLPEHYSNSNVYMSVIRGKLSIDLDDQGVHKYDAGNLLKIPKGIKMNVKNLDEDTLELIVVKSPAPSNM